MNGQLTTRGESALTGLIVAGTFLSGVLMIALFVAIAQGLTAAAAWLVSLG
jgi:hypothetical protein